MKDMGYITHAPADKRILELKALINSFASNEKCKEEIKQWQIEISNNPHELMGRKISAGNMVMGLKEKGSDQRIEFGVENA